MRKSEIINSLHPIVRSDPFVNEIAESVGKKLDQTDSALKDYENQFDIDIATWMIPLYEKELGIVTNVSRPLNDRRSAIKAKWRGMGKIGIKEIQTIAKSWANGDVDVRLVNKKIEITFVNVIGLPPYLDDVKSAINDFTPSHIEVIYNIIYNQFKQLKTKTHRQLKGYTHAQLRASRLN